jgi:hypothetical protein
LGFFKNSYQKAPQLLAGLHFHGAEEGIRTLDPRLGKAMLYR